VAEQQKIIPVRAATSRPKLLLPSGENAGAPQRKDKAAATSRLYVGTRRDVGRSLLGVDGKQSGTIPPITMDYQRTLGWRGYIEAMERLGGRFVILDRRTDRVRGLVDLCKSDVIPTRDADLLGLSPRLREIQQEDATGPLMARARAKFGEGDYALVLLLPLNVDFDIVGGIAKRLADSGIDIKTVARVLGEYEGPAGALRLQAREVVFRDGRLSSVNFTIDL
jgi:hypothetical protein